MMIPNSGNHPPKGVKAMIEKSMNLLTCNPNDLVDLREVHIDTSLPLSERRAEFLSQVGNPYLFKVDGLMIRTVFRPDSKSSFSDALCALLSP